MRRIAERPDLEPIMQNLKKIADHVLNDNNLRYLKFWKLKSTIHTKILCCLDLDMISKCKNLSLHICKCTVLVLFSWIHIKVHVFLLYFRASLNATPENMPEANKQFENFVSSLPTTLDKTPVIMSKVQIFALSQKSRALVAGFEGMRPQCNVSLDWIHLFTLNFSCWFYSNCSV